MKWQDRINTLGAVPKGDHYANYQILMQHKNWMLLGRPILPKLPIKFQPGSIGYIGHSGDFYPGDDEIHKNQHGPVQMVCLVVARIRNTQKTNKEVSKNQKSVHHSGGDYETAIQIFKELSSKPWVSHPNWID